MLSSVFFEFGEDFLITHPVFVSDRKFCPSVDNTVEMNKTGLLVNTTQFFLNKKLSLRLFDLGAVHTVHTQTSAAWIFL